jgi:hypothetical protein
MSQHTLQTFQIKCFQLLYNLKSLLFFKYCEVNLPSHNLNELELYGTHQSSDVSLLIKNKYEEKVLLRH